MPKGIVLTPEQKNIRRHMIFNAALDTFIEKGFFETSMREIAELAGMGKSSLYDYYKTKDEILIFMAEESLEVVISHAKRIIDQDEAAAKRLRQIMQMHLEYVVANKKLYMIFSLDSRRMNPESQKRVQKGRYVYQDLVCRVVEEGISEGSLREVDPLIIARLLINTLLPVVFTSRPTGTPQEMLEESLDVILHGIQA